MVPKIMKTQHPIIKGTLILTLTGMLSRVIGFFYRIFLSHTIGAEGMGIYQLIFPIYAICFSLTAAGIQTAISKFAAEYTSMQNKDGVRDTLMVGLVLSVSLSILTGLVLIQNASYISLHLLGEPRCIPLLKIIALSFPFGSIHCCINGYYYGLKKTSVPAFSQLIEQTIRVASVFLICQISIRHNNTMNPSIAVVGIVLGEIASTLYAVTAITWNRKPLSFARSSLCVPSKHLKNILTLSLPLTANRVCIGLLQSAEAILIPSRLKLFGLSTSESLSTYGTLTGMALPFILFPSALTNSVAVMLLPTIAEEQASNRIKEIKLTIKKTTKYCILLGVLFTVFFLLFGKMLGMLVFKSILAGKFMIILAWICPFLYLNTTLGSILNGLGKTSRTFIHNILGLGIRILFVLFLIPEFGILGYLWGLLASELSITFLDIWALNRYIATAG